MWAPKSLFSIRFRIWILIGAFLSTLTGCDMVGYTSFFEQPNYRVLHRLSGGEEIREYSERIFAEGQVNGKGKLARRDAFKLLLTYISGANESAKKISMTIPVSVNEISRPARKDGDFFTPDDKGYYTMRFFLPRAYNIKSAPTPKNKQVRIGYIPSRLEAALKYKGSQSDAKAQIQKERLINALSASNWKPTAEPTALFYNPPFSIPLLRRNEVTVSVEER